MVSKDAAENMIFLPTLKRGGKKAAEAAADRIARGKAVTATEKVLAAYAKRTGHQGRHLTSYLTDLDKRLRDIMERHVAGKIDDAAAKAEIAAMQSEMRAGLESGYIILQKSEQASLHLGAVVSLAGLGVVMDLSEKAYNAKVARLEAYIEGMINGGFTKGMNVEDYFPGASWAKAIDWFNPLDLYRTADKMAIALKIQNDPKMEAHLGEVAKYLGLVPSEERYNARVKAYRIIFTAMKNKRRLTEEDIEFLEKNDHHLGGIQITFTNGDVIKFGPKEEYQDE